MARYLKNYKAGVAIAFVSMVIATLTLLFMPLLFADGINIIETNDPTKLDIIVRYFVNAFHVQGSSNILTTVFIIFVINGSHRPRQSIFAAIRDVQRRPRAAADFTDANV